MTIKNGASAPTGSACLQKSQKVPGLAVFYEVRATRNGQSLMVDGPFFTYDEARTSSDLLRGTYRNARAREIHWHEPEASPLTLELVDACKRSRELLSVMLTKGGRRHE
ncbi:hypothetical protein [Pseudomonas sp. PI1]|uniref:hypothetical protein n=1 Tax=Pseudomonas sp. PI1 TaxID=1582493 RepID=UPI0006916FD3|nr:hypothetical protein [Pseudomonas sp. PI1]KWR74861.1 hypothetical protein RN02_24660 [Pseudomonas sp. PI1]